MAPAHEKIMAHRELSKSSLINISSTLVFLGNESYTERP
jgi:hypothetical protein